LAGLKILKFITINLRQSVKSMWKKFSIIKRNDINFGRYLHKISWSRDIIFLKQTMTINYNRFKYFHFYLSAKIKKLQAYEKTSKKILDHV
jgi:hypothetical protein